MLRNSRISDLSLLLASIWLLETVLSKFYALFYADNIIIYNIYTHTIIVFYFFTFRSNRSKTGLIFFIWFATTLFINQSFKDLFVESYLLGLFLSCVPIVFYLIDKIFYSSMEHLYKDYKVYLGTGILLFLSCSFPMLYFWHSHTVTGGDKGLFMNLLQVGNAILSSSYLIAAIVHYRWTPLQK